MTSYEFSISVFGNADYDGLWKNNVNVSSGFIFGRLRFCVIVLAIIYRIKYCIGSFQYVSFASLGWLSFNKDFLEEVSSLDGKKCLLDSVDCSDSSNFMISNNSKLDTCYMRSFI
jgi:hypothetical protein